MTEYEKLCQALNIKKIELDYPDNIEPFYPEFTPEKQFKLILLISHSHGLLIKQNRFFVGFELHNPNELICSEDKDLKFDEALASLALFLINKNKIEPKNIRKIING